MLDTSDDMCGELIFTVFAAIAKFRRQQIVKGTREGLDAARILLSAAQTRNAVAAKLRVARWTLCRAVETTPR